MEGAFANTAKPLESTVGESTSETYGIIELLIWSILDSNLRVLTSKNFRTSRCQENFRKGPLWKWQDTQPLTHGSESAYQLSQDTRNSLGALWKQIGEQKRVWFPSQHVRLAFREKLTNLPFTLPPPHFPEVACASHPASALHFLFCDYFCLLSLCPQRWSPHLWPEVGCKSDHGSRLPPLCLLHHQAPSPWADSKCHRYLLGQSTLCQELCKASLPGSVALPFKQGDIHVCIAQWTCWCYSGCWSV